MVLRALPDSAVLFFSPPHLYWEIIEIHHCIHLRCTSIISYIYNENKRKKYPHDEKNPRTYTLLSNFLLFIWHSDKLITWLLRWADMPNFWCPAYPAQGPEQVWEDVSLWQQNHACLPPIYLIKYFSSSFFHKKVNLNMMGCFPYLIKSSSWDPRKVVPDIHTPIKFFFITL